MELFIWRQDLLLWYEKSKFRWGLVKLKSLSDILRFLLHRLRAWTFFPHPLSACFNFRDLGEFWSVENLHQKQGMVFLCMHNPLFTLAPGAGPHLHKLRVNGSRTGLKHCCASFLLGKESKVAPLRNWYLCSLKIEVICLYSTKVPRILGLVFHHKKRKRTGFKLQVFNC